MIRRPSSRLDAYGPYGPQQERWQMRPIRLFVAWALRRRPALPRSGDWRDRVAALGWGPCGGNRADIVAPFRE
jgi:hypothetical protein